MGRAGSGRPACPWSPRTNPPPCTHTTVGRRSGGPLGVKHIDALVRMGAADLIELGADIEGPCLASMAACAAAVFANRARYGASGRDGLTSCPPPRPSRAGLGPPGGVAPEVQAASRPYRLAPSSSNGQRFGIRYRVSKSTWYTPWRLS